MTNLQTPEFPQYADVGKRIRQARRDMGLTQAVLARRLGVSRAAVSYWETGTYMPPHDMLGKIARSTRHSVVWLACGEADTETPQLSLAYQNSAVSAGQALQAADAPANLYRLPVLDVRQLPAGPALTSASSEIILWDGALRDRRVDPEQAAVIYVEGPSMEHILPGGARVIVDRRVERLIDGQLYALRDVDMLKVRVVHPQPGGGLRLRAYSSSYSDEDISASDARERIQVIGRVCGCQWAIN